MLFKVWIVNVRVPCGSLSLQLSVDGIELKENAVEYMNDHLDLVQ